MSDRIDGFDFARALAVYGMVAVNFRTVISGTEEPAWSEFLGHVIEGRAAALFVILAGVGVSLMTVRARTGGAPERRECRRRVLGRAGLLLVAGALYSPLWRADILHFYGVYLALAACLITASGRTLLLAAAGCAAAFVGLYLVLDYNAGWDWETLYYEGFWSFPDALRRIFFNGFHPVFPWVTFVFFGMWLGRLDFREAALRKKVISLGLPAWAGATALSWIAMRNAGGEGFLMEGVNPWFGTGATPPLPLYLLSAAGAGVVVIALSVALTERFGSGVAVRALCRTGRLSLTLYVAHVVVGMTILAATGLIGNESAWFSWLAPAVFCLLGTIFAWLWLARFSSGPLEWVYRRIAG